MANSVNENEYFFVPEIDQSKHEELIGNDDDMASESDLDVNDERRSQSSTKFADDIFAGDESTASQCPSSDEQHAELDSQNKGEKDGFVSLDEGSEMGRILIRQRNQKSKRNNLTDLGSNNSNGAGNRDDGDDDCVQNSNGTRGEGGRKTASRKTFPTGLKTFAFLIVLSFLPIGYLWYKDALAKRVSTRLDAPRVIEEEASSALKSPERFWGTYRPGVYFGNNMIHESDMSEYMND